MFKCNNRKMILSMIGLALSLTSGSVLASFCQPQWHNAITMQDGAITLEKGADTFLIKPSGQLYYGVHKVKLNEQQLAVLADYHSIMIEDLPYVLSHSQFIDQELCERVAKRQMKEHEIQSLIPALKNWRSVSFK
ncbi:hypothetical protein MD588_17180 [Photobacterium sp. SDRW27]|uniref:hypothetical protein n=1 Tax=Photobacterium obscurum TaxID=2829490 RepID=UPI0022448EAB|nr:hypothetical protein [Photobacterium obscurum]MCW8330541.1 hypothetical protein [Photobacterium obscurum]